MDEPRSIRLRLLGGWDLVVDGVSQPMGSRQQRLIAALAIHGRRARSLLGGLLWPDGTEAHAMGSLRAAIFATSRRVPGLIVVRGHDLCLGEDVDVDLHRLRSALSADPEDAADPEGWFASSSNADLLPGWYDEWVVGEQERLLARYLDVAEGLAGRALAGAEPFRALHLAQTVRDRDPLRESAARILVRAHMAMGNYATALRTYEQFAAFVADELGTQPSPQMLELIVPARRA